MTPATSPRAPKQSATERLSGKLFAAVHRRNLVYNCCWEDPDLDRVALDFQPADRVVVITSAGCNALDYLLAGAGEVNAVDMNPIQNALLDLKRAGIKRLDHAAFWELFGQGASPRARELYHDALRQELTPFAQKYWDKHIGFFAGGGYRHSFYYRGTSGLLARLVMSNLHLQRLRKPLAALLESGSVQEQKAVYETRLSDKLWTPWLKWFLSRSATLSLAGVPWPQRQQIRTQYPGGVAKFIRDAIEAVLTDLPFKRNYFWRVYLEGHYSPDCCPSYLTPDGFAALKAGKIDGLKVHTNSVTGFLEGATPGLTKFVLLDHMDWLALRHPDALAAEWNAILKSAGPDARVIFRSAGLHVDFIDPLVVQHRGKAVPLGSLLTYHRDLAAELHKRDRVHTYGNFTIADLPSGA